MFRFRIALALISFLLLPSLVPAQSYMRVISWNTRHMGWSGETNWAGYADQAWKQFGSASNSPNGFDVIFMQEVMYDTSVTSFVSALTSVSGVSWAHSTTAAIGRTSYKERYSVVYRTDRVQLLSSYVWNDVGDKFEREPQIVKLRDKNTNADYTFINWHTIWGTSAQRQQEIADIVNVFKTVQNADTSDQDVILLGDHNQSATHSWFAPLTSTANISPVVSYRVNDLTTINTSCAFASAYDHFWFQASYVTEFSNAGRDYIASMCTFRSGLSDHAPVWMRLYSTSDTD